MAYIIEMKKTSLGSLDDEHIIIEVTEKVFEQVSEILNLFIEEFPCR